MNNYRNRTNAEFVRMNEEYNSGDDDDKKQ